MTARVVLQSAFVLHTRAFRDTSLLVDFFTLQYGRISAVARGARSAKSKLRGLLLQFVPLLISWSGNGELVSLGKTEASDLSYNLVGNALLSGIYLNELLMRLLHRHDPHAQLYQNYQVALAGLQHSCQIQPALRLFEKQLLREIGYGLELDRTIDGKAIGENDYYSHETERGFVKCTTKNIASFKGASLLALHHNLFTTKEQLSDAKRLIRKIITRLLGDKPLKSRELTKQMFADLG